MDSSNIVNKFKEILNITKDNQRVPCPFHEGDKNNFQLQKGGNGTCWSSCNKQYSIHEIGKKLEVDTSSVSGLTSEGLLNSKALPVEATIKLFGLKDVEKNKKKYVEIPYRNVDGTVAYSKKRYSLFKSEVSDGIVHGNPPNVQTIPYNLNRIKKDSQYLIIVEGETDVWSLAFAGIDNVLGVAGASNINFKKYDHIFKTIKNIYIWYEKDNASKKFLQKALEYNPEIKVLIHPKYKDPSEINMAEGNFALAEFWESNKDSALNVAETINRFNQERKQEILDMPEVNEIRKLPYVEMIRTIQKEAEYVLAKGTVNTVVATILTFASAGMGSPLKIFLKGESGIGKTYPLEASLKYFLPEDNIFKMTAGTEASWVNQPNTFQDKLVVCSEIDNLPSRKGKEGDSPIVSAWRNGTSDNGEFIYVKSVPDTKAETGFRVVEINKGGNFSVITTGVKSPEWQTDTRFLTLPMPSGIPIRDSISQFKIDKYSGTKPKKVPSKAWKYILELPTLLPIDLKRPPEDKPVITIKFLESLFACMPDELKPEGRFNRDSDNLIAGMIASAILRASLETATPSKIEVTLDDYEIFREIFDKVFVASSVNLSPVEKKYVDIIYENTEATVEQVGTSYKGLTQKELGEKMRKANYGHAKATVSENLKKLVENNYIYVLEYEKPKVYYAVENFDELHLPTRSEVEAHMNGERTEEATAPVEEDSSFGSSDDSVNEADTKQEFEQSSFADTGEAVIEGVSH